MKRLSLSSALVFAAVAERLWWDLGPNVELIMTVSVLASIYLGKNWGIAVALVSLAISDLVLGNTMIMIFTWSGFALIALFGTIIKRRALVAGIYGLASALFFYFYTNFGVWLIGGLYPHTLAGLMRSYIMGLPFLRLHAVTSVLFLTLSVSLIEIIILAFKMKRGIRLDSGAVPQL
ncbi:MAG: hypothetical protein UY17_C0041G0002 [Candidatus Beckwithbacteria bacterium GW2011_GWC2_47_9]|uniref:Rod shape-determining protein MreD n=1 Tax=Candidatus Beckwithbacteria bacterium GW2011_GWC2_47_9 TaxID=1618373 RepID=A0A0G1WWX3_9BACT|nr:MAG: hypothetical protein UY17_C0041G0002 [Candidatus Beckwithbacteria bacterium GW2011_GWC2_47_9]